MPNKIKPKRSYTANSVPLTSDLDTHELAINWVDGKAFTKNAAGNIVSVTLGGGGGSGEDAVLRALFVPAAPTSVTATAGNAQATVSWTAPSVLAQTPITDYVVQFQQSGGSWETFSDGTSTATSATVTGLTNGTAYQFRVASVNAIGQGPWSTASSAVTPAGVVPDPYFANVSLLLHMDGTGSTFVDSSATPKAITAVGGATQSTAQSKFGGRSLLCDGSGDYLTVDDAAIAVGSNDFTIEAWIYPLSLPGGIFTLWGHRANEGTIGGALLTHNYGDLRLYIANAGSNNWQVSNHETGLTLTAGQWQHVAMVRSGNTIRIFLDGVQGTAASVATGAIGTSGAFSIMAGSGAGTQEVHGHLDEFRLTLGVARYTANFTPPTAEFPAPVSAPTSLTATAGNAQVSLTWTAPAYNGGSAITGYRVEYTPSGGSPTVVSTGSTSTSYTLTGLTNGTAYVFRVAGVNANGTGTYTAASSSVTPAAALFSATAAGWSGAGSEASKLVAPSSPTDFVGGTVKDASFTAGVAGTVRVTGAHHDGNDGFEARVLKNNTAVYASGAYGDANVSLSVIAGDVVRVFADGSAGWMPNTRVWLVPS